MSTIKSSSEHLTLNADGSSKDIKFQANGVEKASISSAGAFTSTTIDATKLTGNLPAISGANLTGISSVGGATGVDFNDNVKARFGTGNDLAIYHDSSHSYIEDTGTGNLHLLTNHLSVNNAADTEAMIHATQDAGVSLYYNNVKTFETMDGGVKVTGTLKQYNVAEASTDIAAAAKTFTISGLHTLNPGNHWDRMSIWMWLTGTGGGYTNVTSKHWRHEIQAINSWAIPSGTEVYGGTPPTVTTVTSGSNTNTLQFTVTQPAGNAALRIVAFGHSLGSNTKISET